MHAVSGLLRADFTGQGHLGEDGAGGLLADMQDAESAERRTTLKSSSGQGLTHAVAAFGTRMRCK